MGLSHVRTVIVLAVFAACTTVAARAQDVQFRSTDSPYQEEFDYRLGEALEPNVEIEGLRWTLVRIEPRDPDFDPDDDDVAVDLTVAFDNRGTDDVRAQIVVLLEDGDGRPLDRLTLEPVRVRDGRTEEDDERFEVPGADLVALEKLYLFLELDR